MPWYETHGDVGILLLVAGHGRQWYVGSRGASAVNKGNDRLQRRRATINQRSVICSFAFDPVYYCCSVWLTAGTLAYPGIQALSASSRSKASHIAMKPSLVGAMVHEQGGSARGCGFGRARSL